MIRRSSSESGPLSRSTDQDCERFASYAPALCIRDWNRGVANADIPLEVRKRGLATGTGQERAKRARPM